MLKVTALIITFYAFNISVAGAEGNYWFDRAIKQEYFAGQFVTALGAVNRTLYIGANKSFFTLSLPGNKLIDQTAKIEKLPNDEITSILISQGKEEVWISTNGNTYSGKCYRYDLSPCQAQSSFLNNLLKEDENLPKPACCGIETFATEGEQVVEGYFKGNVYLCTQKTQRCKLVYKPTSYYNWAVASLMTGTTAYVATSGDGLIVIDRKTGSAARFPDKDQNYIRAIALDGEDIFFGAGGLYKATVRDFALSSGSALQTRP